MDEWKQKHAAEDLGHTQIANFSIKVITIKQTQSRLTQQGDQIIRSREYHFLN